MASKRPSAAVRDLREKIKLANDYLRQDRDKFLTLSLGKFTVRPGMPALATQNLEEIAVRQEDAPDTAFNGNTFGAKLADRLRIHHAHQLGEARDRKKLVEDAHDLLVQAVGTDWKQQIKEEEEASSGTAGTAVQGKLSSARVVSRFQHLTDCLWRYLPLVHMTTHHLWSMLDLLRNAGVDASTDVSSMAGMADCVSDLVEALGIVARTQNPLK